MVYSTPPNTDVPCVRYVCASRGSQVEDDPSERARNREGIEVAKASSALADQVESMPTSLCLMRC